VAPIALLIAGLAGLGLMAAPPLSFRQSAFLPGRNGPPLGWTVWNARPETAPRAYVERVVNRGEPGALAISGAGNAAANGGWEHSVPGIRAGSWYRFTAFYRFWGAPAESWQVLARLDWRRPDGRRAGEPNHVPITTPDGEWKKCTLDAQAPAESDRVVMQLYLSNAPLGTVVWDDVSLEEIAAPGARDAW